MSLSASATLTVADQAPTTAAATAVVQAPVGYGTGGRGRLVHPTLGAYDYVNTPDEIENVDGDIIIPPIWAHAQTIGGAVDALWSGYPRDVKVTERWAQGDVGCPIEHLRQLYQFFANPPPLTGTPVIWTPNYINAKSYNVALVDLRSGGSAGYKLAVRIARWGYAPKPVELDLRILGYAS